MASAVALSWVFPPYGVGWLAFVCLVPWAVATCRTQRAWLAHWLSFLIGSAFFMVTLRWLYPVTDLGYLALALYLAIYWPLAAWAIRTGRRHGVSPLWTLPFVWVACEFLRGTVMTGFPWLFLSHGLYEQLWLLQISDLTGAYGVSFVAAMVNGVLVELALRRWPATGPPLSIWQLRVGAVVAVGLLAGTLWYGTHRLGQIDFCGDESRHGPRVAVIQHDFPMRSTSPHGEHPYVILASYLALAAEAAQHHPDLVAFPETVWGSVQNLDFIEKERAAIDEAQASTWVFGKQCHLALSGFARGDYALVNEVLSRLEADLQTLGHEYPTMRLPTRLPRLPASGPPVTVIVGSVSIKQFPEATYPKVRRYNSALVYDPDGEQRRLRYDKRHLVPFGEVVPFRQSKFLGIDLHYWLYRPLNKLSPFSYGGKIEYSLSPGRAFTIFDLVTPSETYAFGTPICYEDATPYVIREFVWDGDRRRVDFLVNISNDGWFLHQYELPQHLAICALRAVENRVCIARAVNTGVSGFIDPNGRIYSRVATEDGRWFGAGVVGYDIQPVYLDDRSSLYGRWGDWFAKICLAVSTALWLGAVLERWVLAIQHRIAARLRKGVAK